MHITYLANIGIGFLQGYLEAGNGEADPRVLGGLLGATASIDGVVTGIKSDGENRLKEGLAAFGKSGAIGGIEIALGYGAGYIGYILVNHVFDKG
tara:strand:+ start:94432 stop:94716 length:285 start_codon:yes stop_codon:yes gene_type:complete